MGIRQRHRGKTLSWSVRAVLQKISYRQHSHMHSRSASLTKAVVSIGIDHVVERLPEFDLPISQPFADLNVCVGFAGAGDDQQLALSDLRQN